MLKNKQFVISNLKKVDDIGKRLYPDPVNKKIEFNISIIEKGLYEVYLLETGKYPKDTYDEDIDSVYDEIIIPIDDDVFDKKQINVNIIKNLSAADSFPNALLMENITEKKRTEPKIQPAIVPKNNNNVSNKKEDIWDILNQIKKENNSDSLDALTTESEYSNTEMTDTALDSKDLFDAENAIEVTICKGCNSEGTLIEDPHASVVVCSECGMVNEELLDHGPEWRQYNNEDSSNEGVSRCGMPSNFFFPKSSQGTIMAGSSNNRLKRKQKWNSMVYKERSLNQVFEYISQVCSNHGIPRIIVDSARILYKKINDCKHKNGSNVGKQIIIRGENRVSIIAACVFKACEMNKNPRSVKEIAKYFELDEKKVTKGNKQFEKIMKNVEDNMIILDNLGSSTAEDYIRRHCPKLKINKENTEIAVRISNNCCRMKLASDHNPQSIAAGSILVMVNFCNLRIDKKDIAKLFGTSDVTISKIYNKVIKYVEALIDDDATDYLIEKFKING